MDSLQQQKDAIGTEFNNISNFEWIVARRAYLKAQYELLDMQINNLKEKDATAQPANQNSSNKRTRRKAVSGAVEGTVLSN